MRRASGAYHDRQAPQDPEYSKLQRLVEAELRDNELEQARQRNRPVVYGQAVQLRHVLTNRYLYISSTEASRLDILNMQVSMADAPSKRTPSRCPSAPHARVARALTNCDRALRRAPLVAPDTYFRIMPRFKVRSEGDVVRIHDQVRRRLRRGEAVRIVLVQRVLTPRWVSGGGPACLQIVVESLKTSGQFIHAGGRFSADSMDANMVEVDLSVQRSSFVLYPHITLPPAAAERTLLRVRRAAQRDARDGVRHAAHGARAAATVGRGRRADRAATCCASCTRSWTRT